MITSNRVNAQRGSGARMWDGGDVGTSGCPLCQANSAGGLVAGRGTLGTACSGSAWLRWVQRLYGHFGRLLLRATQLYMATGGGTVRGSRAPEVGTVESISSHRERVVVVLLLALAAVILPAGARADGTTVPAGSLTSALHWRLVGPFTGGRATSVAGVARSPNLYYAAYAGGGIWKTSNYGATWSNISGSQIPSGAVGAIAVAPSDPKVIYAGTGDPAIRNTFLTGNGMYKSVNGGKTWSYIGLRRTHVISWIIVDPSNPRVVYVAALGHVWAPNPQRGVYKTTNGGKSWKKVLYVNNKTGAITLTMDPMNSSVLYAGMWQVYRRPWTLNSGGPGSGIYKTTDGGEHWTNITHNAGLPKGIFGTVGVAVAPSDPNIVYALVQAKISRGHPGGLFRSNDGGRTWSLMNDSLHITQRMFYFQRIYVDPQDANTVYIMNSSLWVSHDGGRKISVIVTPHVDNHALWINPKNPDDMVEANDNGATVTLNGGKNWSTVHNQPTGQFYHVTLSNQFPYQICGGEQDNDAWCGPSAVSSGRIPAVWTPVAGGENGWIAITPGDPNVLYGDGFGGKVWRTDRKRDLVTTVSPWPGVLSSGLKASRHKYRYSWIHHVMRFGPGDTDRLFVGSQYLLMTANGGLTWKAVSPDLTRNDISKQQRPGGPIESDVSGEENFDTISTIGVSPVDSSVIWTGSDDGLVYVTKDLGRHWQQVRPPQLPKWSTIMMVEPSHTAAGTAFVAASRYEWDDFHPYLYKTTDYGRHWIAITSGLPADQYVTSVRQDPNDPRLLLAGTESTVYVSFDGGTRWAPLTLNLPPVRVTDIAFQPTQHAAVISTFGRAFWAIDNVQALERFGTAKVTRGSPYLFKPQQAWLVKRFGGGGSGAPPKGAATNGANVPVGATVFFYLPRTYEPSDSVTLRFASAGGKTIRTFRWGPDTRSGRAPAWEVQPDRPRAALHAGMNAFQWNLRYPTAVDIRGIFHSGFFGAATPVGPMVVPGVYQVTLSYGRRVEKQTFAVKLDPRLDTTPSQLQDRFSLLMQLHKTVGQLALVTNRAIGVESALKEAGRRRPSGIRAKGAQAEKALSRDISEVVDFRITSDEGSLVYPLGLRGRLTEVAGAVGSAFVAPTSAMVQASKIYLGKAEAMMARLRADIAAAQKYTDVKARRSDTARSRPALDGHVGGLR